MAVYHCSVKTIKRSAGRSATAASAYRSGTEIVDEKTGEIHDYTKKSGVVHSQIMTPTNCPTNFRDRETLWNEVEQIEKRKDAQLAREVVVALPAELDQDQQLQLVQQYVQEQFVNLGMIADLNIHEPSTSDHDIRNFHAHIQLTLRDVDEDGFGKKNRDWNDKALVKEWRESWADLQNHALGQAGSESRVDHRSLKDQGLDQVPTIHLGVAASAMEKRGEPSERGDINREVEQINLEIAELKKQQVVALDQYKDLKAEAEAQPPSLADLHKQLAQLENKTDQVYGLLSRKQQLQNVTSLQLVNQHLSQLGSETSNKLEVVKSLSRAADQRYENALYAYEQQSFFKKLLPNNCSNVLQKAVEKCEELDAKKEELKEQKEKEDMRFKAEATRTAHAEYEQYQKEIEGIENALELMPKQEEIDQLKEEIYNHPDTVHQPKLEQEHEHEMSM